MEAGKKALRCLIISNSQTFLKTITKNLSSYRRSFEIRSSNNPSNIKNLIFYQELAIIEDEYIHQTAENVLVDLVSFLHASQIKVILVNDFKKKLPEFVARRDDFIRFLSKSASNQEFEFVLDQIDYVSKDRTTGRQGSHSKYSESIIQIQNNLLGKKSLNCKIKDVLKIVGMTAEASRVALFENKYDNRGKFLMTLRSEWINGKHILEEDHPMFKAMPYQPNFNRWSNALAGGRIINGAVHKFPYSEETLLKNLGIKNLLLLPISFKGLFWGFMLIAVNRPRRLWSKEELPYLKSIVSPISSFLELKQEEKKNGIEGENIEDIFKDSKLGLFIMNREGNIQSSNRAFCEILGFSQQEIKSQNLKSISFADDFQKEAPAIKELLVGTIPSYFTEKRFFSKSGELIWVNQHISAYNLQNGRPELLLGIADNTNKLKQAEKALDESEERFQMLSTLALEGIVFHRQGIIVDQNQRFLELSGYSSSTLNGKNIVNILADSASRELFKKKMANRKDDWFVANAITNTGEKYPVEIKNGVISKKGESLQYTLIRDISERRKTQYEIRKLNTAINQSPSSIVITNIEGKIEFVNESFCEISGYTAEEVLGNNPRFLKTDHHSDAYYENLWETINRGDTWQGIFKNRAKNGNIFWERAVISPIFDERKNITHFLAIKENITKEKETREALEKSEERHRIISELTNDFVYSAVIKDNKININWKSGSLEKLAGFELQDINEKAFGWYSIVKSEDLEKTVFPSIFNLNRFKTRNFEYRITTKGGKEKWVSDKIRLIDEEGGKLYIIGAIQDITVRKRTNIALDQSKRYLDSIIDNLPVGLQIFDELGFTTRVNETQRKLLGVNDFESGKETFNILHDPESKARGVDKLYREVYEKKKTINHELEIIVESQNLREETNEQKITVNEIIFPIVKEDGKVHSVISLTHDITQRVVAEKALKASEMHQKALLRIIPDLILVFTNDGIFKDVYTESNDRLLFDTENFINKRFSDVFPSELSDLFYTNLQKAVETGDMQSFKYDLLLDNQTLYYETRLLVSKENEVIAVIRDITDNTIAELTIKESEEKFRQLAERTQDTLILFSAANEILYVSPNLEKIIGISAEHYIENPLKALRLIHLKDRKWVVPTLNQYRKDKFESIDLQFRVILEGNIQKWLWYRENTIFDENHNPQRYAAVMTDITSSKKSEQQLKEAKEEAEKAYRSKSVFLANMSHEIRTPMNAVLGFTDLLYSRISDPALKGYLSSIKSSGNTLLNLLNDILDLSKIEAEKMRIINSPVNLFTAFEEVKHIFSLKAREKGLNYSFKLDKNIPESLLLDELRLKQILLNLIDNAIKFTEKGGVKVKAKILKQSKDGEIVDLQLSVEDSGIGIPENLHEAVFESFRQQDDRDKKKFKGTGLGLAITKRLVELCNGTIALKSKEGKGSKFEVILRDVEVSESIISFVDKENRKLGFEEAALKDKLIVLVDEQQTNRDLIKEVFRKSESRVIEGDSVESVLGKVKGDVDLFILEMKNPGSLLEDLIFINNHTGLKNATKIGITSISEFNLEPKILDAFKAILTKPIQLDEFVEIVEDHFSNESEKTNGGAVFPDDIMDFRVLNEVIKLLKGELHEQWESATKTSSFSEIEQFASNVKEVGTEYHLDTLNTFSDVLTTHVKNFDIDRISEVLNTYPSIIKELKGNLKNLASDN